MKTTILEPSPLPPPLRPGGRIPHSLRALRHRNFRLYLSGQLVSLVGTFLQVVGQGWLVYELSGSPMALGVVGFAQFAPLLVLSPFAGVVADRVPKRRLLLISQLGMMALALALGTLSALGVVAVWHVVVLALCFGVFAAFDAPARQSFVFEMVGKDDLMNAIALNSSVFTTARLVGPALAGMLIAPLGVASLFFLNAAAFLAIIVNLLRMELPPFSPPPKARGWDSFLEGLRYVRTHASIRPLLAWIGVVSVFGMSYATVLPAYAIEALGSDATGFGFLMAASALGGLLAAVGMALARDGGRKGRLMMLANLVFALLLLVVAGSHWFWLSWLCLIGVGWGGVIQSAMTNTLIQTLSPDHLRGRVMGAFTWVFGGLFPVGNLLMGALGAWWGTPVAIGGGAMIVLAFGIWTQLRHPKLRAL